MADKANKRKHETLSLAKKVEILKKLDSGQKKVKLAREYNVGRATIYDIKKNRKKIDNFVSNAGLEASSRHTVKHCEYLLMEDVLFSWFVEERRHNKPLTNKAIQKKSLHFYKEIYKNDNFKASDGWYRNFKTRYGIRGLYEQLAKKNITKFNDLPHNFKQSPGTGSAFPSQTLAKSEGSAEKIGKIVPKIEPREKTIDDLQNSEDCVFSDAHTEIDSAEDDSSVSPEKKEVPIEYNDYEDDSSIFIAHMKTRMDKLNHQQRFIAQKLMSDVMMLAETDQLQLTSAIVNRSLKMERQETGKRNDPLNLD